jgi:hypothetical protein
MANPYKRKTPSILKTLPPAKRPRAGGVVPLAWMSSSATGSAPSTQASTNYQLKLGTRGQVTALPTSKTVLATTDALDAETSHLDDLNFLRPPSPPLDEMEQLLEEIEQPGDLSGDEEVRPSASQRKPATKSKKPSHSVAVRRTTPLSKITTNSL